MNKIVSELRINSCVIKPSDNLLSRFGLEIREVFEEETMEVKAIGTWSDDRVEMWATTEKDRIKFPISLHFTTYPGCEIVPLIGDKITIIIEHELADPYSVEDGA